MRYDDDLAAVEEIQQPIVVSSQSNTQLINPVSQVVGNWPPQIMTLLS
jgi:hypothetical protein